MTVKKIPISFNDEDQADIKELIYLMRIVGVYGDIPKAVKFGIKLALSTIKNPAKVYSDLNEDNLGFYFNSIRTRELKRRDELQALELMKKQPEGITSKKIKVYPSYTERLYHTNKNK